MSKWAFRDQLDSSKSCKKSFWNEVAKWCKDNSPNDRQSVDIWPNYLDRIKPFVLICENAECKLTYKRMEDNVN